MGMKNRKANRMREYDYSQAGYYFVTICTQNRKELFGEIIDGRMIANAAGKMVEETWDELSRFYEGIRTDQFQIMPNHVHGIMAIVHVGQASVPVRTVDNHRGLSLRYHYLTSYIGSNHSQPINTSRVSKMTDGNPLMKNYGNVHFTIILSAKMRI